MMRGVQGRYDGMGFTPQVEGNIVGALNLVPPLPFILRQSDRRSSSKSTAQSPFIACRLGLQAVRLDANMLPRRAEGSAL